MADITITGDITIQDNKNQSYTIPAEDFEEDQHLDGTMSTFGYDTGEWSVKRDVEKKDGVISWGDWQKENCKITKDNISFS